MLRARQVRASFRSSLPAGSTACAWGFVRICAEVGSPLLPSGAAFFYSTSALLLAVSAFWAWSAAGTWLTRRNVARKTAANICRIIEPPIAACRVVGETKTAVCKGLIAYREPC